MTLLNVQYDLQVKSIIKYKTLSYNRDFRVLPYISLHNSCAKLTKIDMSMYLCQEQFCYDVMPIYKYTETNRSNIINHN